MTEWLHFHFSLSCIGEGNGNPFQCSCLENPRDGEVWWAAVSGVAQSRTRLKWLSSSSSSIEWSKSLKSINVKSIAIKWNGTYFHLLKITLTDATFMCKDVLYLLYTLAIVYFHLIIYSLCPHILLNHLL